MKTLNATVKTIAKLSALHRFKYYSKGCKFNRGFNLNHHAQVVHEFYPKRTFSQILVLLMACEDYEFKKLLDINKESK
jgi:hypothetical protein